MRFNVVPIEGVVSFSIQQTGFVQNYETLTNSRVFNERAYNKNKIMID